MLLPTSIGTLIPSDFEARRTNDKAYTNLYFNFEEGINDKIQTDSAILVLFEKGHFIP